jgi:hypothetical protein
MANGLSFPTSLTLPPNRVIAESRKGARERQSSVIAEGRVFANTNYARNSKLPLK